MEDKEILRLFKKESKSQEYDSSPLDKTLLKMKMRGGASSLFQKNKRRRSKKDKNGRNHKCGCGKKYLSYPALYTHIKNKHGGTPPKGTTKQPQKRGKPGRPSKRSRLALSRMGSMRSYGEATSMVSGSVMSKDDKSDSNSNISDNTDFSPLKSKFGFFNTKDRLKLDSFELIDQVHCKGVSLPTHSFEKKKNIMTNQFVLHPLAEIINKLEHNQTTLEFYANELTCDKIFAIFLFNLSKISNEIFYSMSCVIVRALRECINSFGYDLLDLYDRQNPDAKIELLRENEENENMNKVVYTEIEPCWYISLLFDFFVKEFLPVYIKNKKINLEFVCRFLIGFNEWLVENKLSRIYCGFEDFEFEH